ncbi:MAG: fumarate reductase subunit FrdD [Halioglobus sp.]
MRVAKPRLKTAADYPRSNEPIAWSLFGAGGMVVAFLTPAVVVITGLLLPFLLLVDYAEATELVRHPVAKIFFLVVIVLPLFHAAHRIYHGLHDIHIRANPRLLGLILYGGASVLCLLTVVVLLRLGW